MNNGQTLVELEHVSQVYATGRKRFYAIQDINLSINEGEFVCLLGPSGCGKSTLLRLITGLQRPTEGVVRYRGQELRGVNPHASIVFQTFALFPWLSVQENVEVALKARGVPPKLRTARALDLMGTSPGRIIAEVNVDLPHPRHRKSPQFLKLIDYIYAVLAGQTQPEPVEMGTAPGKPGVTRWLPQIQISDLVGLLEHLAESSEPTYDIYQLTEDFGADSDLVLRLIDTAELLGFVRVGQGDVMLTPLGETFSEASILTRKEIFSTRIRRLPIFQWLINMLQIAENQSLKRDVVRLALELELPPAEAEKQLNTIIEWGRYGELIAYDDETEMLMLEPLAGQAVATH